MAFITHETDPHEQGEELQWAALLAKGDAPAGMALVFIQKLCTAFHEIGPAIDAGIIIDSPESLAFLKARLTARLEKAMTVLADNGLGNIPGVSELQGLREELQQAASLTDVAALTEPIHQVNHTLVDALGE